MEKKIVLGSDHAGYKYRQKLISYLKKKKYDVIDVGCDSEESCDYPDFAKKVCSQVKKNKCHGVLICGTGIGISIAANKVKGIRCGIAYSDEVASLMRQHNDANIIAFGERQMNFEDVKRRLDIFLKSGFEGGKHLRRVKKLEK